MVPLLLGTMYAAWKIQERFEGLSSYVNLSQVCEAQRGGAGDSIRLRRGHPVTRSQMNLSRIRYAYGDDSLYIVGKDLRTNYAQPPIMDMFPGVLTAGRRRYGHPGLFGTLPEPWLPSQEPSTSFPPAEPSSSSSTVDARTTGDSVVLDLRRRWSRMKKFGKMPMANPWRGGLGSGEGGAGQQRGGVGETGSLIDDDPTRAWRGELSNPPSESGGGADREDPFGVIALDSDEEEEGGIAKYKTYYHRGWRRSGVFPGGFPGERGDDTGDQNENGETESVEGEGSGQRRDE